MGLLAEPKCRGDVLSNIMDEGDMSRYYLTMHMLSNDYASP